MNNLVIITAGVDKGKDGNKVSDATRIYSLGLFEKRVVTLCGGYITAHTRGGYIMTDGDIKDQLVTEQGRQYQVLCSDEDLTHLKREAVLLKESLNQESVLFTVQKLNEVEFV